MVEVDGSTTPAAAAAAAAGGGGAGGGAGGGGDGAGVPVEIQWLVEALVKYGLDRVSQSSYLDAPWAQFPGRGGYPQTLDHGQCFALILFKLHEIW